MYKKNYYLSIILLATLSQNFIVSRVAAQEVKKEISLEQAITATLSNNKNIQLSKLDENIAASNFKQTDAIYLPQIGLSYTAFNTNNPLNAFGFKLQQRSVSQNDFNPDILNHPASTSDFSTKLELQQPIVNMDLLYKRKAAAKQTELYKYKTQRTKEYLTFLVTKAYLQLELSYNAVAVLEEALQTTKAVYKFTDDHYQQGLIQKSDVLNTQVYIATVEKDLANAKSNIANASDFLSNLMDVPLGTIYTIHKTNSLAIKDSSLKEKINDSRADFIAMQKAIEASNLMIESSKKSYLPKLNAFGNYQLNDSKALGFGANSYLAGIQVSWDIFKGNRTKNEIITQTLERNKLSQTLAKQKEESQLELSKMNRDLQDGLFAIKQQNLAVEQATEALRILQNRHQQGLVNTTDVLLATTQLSQQKFGLAQAIFNTNVTKAYIQFLASN
jgi:outer membrane protein TolC